MLLLSKTAPTPGLAEPHNSATFTAEVSGPADVSGRPGPACSTAATQFFFVSEFFFLSLRAMFLVQSDTL